MGSDSPSESRLHQVAIVTGASAGIGHAVALKLARDGFHVVLAARRGDRLAEIEQEIKTRGGSALAVPTDITQPNDRQRLVDRTLETFNRVDVLINNAGWGLKAPLETIPVEMIRANFETNVFATIALTQLVIPSMRSQGSGCIVNVSSVAGRIARPFSAVYDATKHALEAISDSWRSELESFAIRVIVIQPGFTRTEFQEVANRESAALNCQASDYASSLEKLNQRTERVRRLAIDPTVIADLISSVIKLRNPRSRYAAPGFARIALLLKRVLPEPAFNRLIG